VNPRARPFDAIKRLRSLMEQNDGKLLSLLMAAEHVKLFPDRAKEFLTHYVDDVRANRFSEKLHPWSLIVAARLDNAHSKNLLRMFIAAFPRQKEILTAQEAKMANEDDKSEATLKNIDWSESLHQEWAALRDKYPDETQSKATEDLLNLTGLRKVKEEAIRLWRYALQLRRMDLETRTKNVAGANYCFLGNPGKIRNYF